MLPTNGRSGAMCNVEEWAALITCASAGFLHSIIYCKRRNKLLVDPLWSWIRSVVRYTHATDATDATDADVWCVIRWSMKENGLFVFILTHTYSRGIL